jgi:uncharacterized repeat protein (TIGR03806 family)
MHKIAVVVLSWLSLVAFIPQEHIHAPKQHLSEYGFFQERLADLKPADRVYPYEVNAPLFSDYAEKLRFLYIPAGAKVQYQAQNAWDFPAGAVLIKNFFYYQDAAAPALGRKIMETRLLIREASGWKAFTYVWNGAQTEATLEVAGDHFPAQWIAADGKKRSLDYVVPNVNQCKGCHSYDGQFRPIGTTTGQLNRNIAGSSQNQLRAWQETGWLELPDGFDPAKAPRLADYRLADSTVELRARAYLEGNCAHCHNPHGPASTSGMFLDIQQTDPAKFGVWKAPVAAGRGSGDRKYGIVPGKPGESILVYRMQQEEPGIRMPELGRQLEHKEGVALISAWIKGMKP